LKDLIQDKIAKQEEDENEDESLINQPHKNELGKLLEVLDMLCIQAKQGLDYETDLERLIKQLLLIRKARGAFGSISDRFLTVK
jgi:hypothetical protein